MAGGSRSMIVGLAILAIASSALYSPASGLPSDPCNVAPHPPAVGDGTISIGLPNRQMQRGWQRQSGAIEVTVTAPKGPANAVPFVCFRWMLNDPKASDEEKYKKFVPGGAVSGSVPSDKPKGPITLAVSVPTALPDAPASPRVAAAGRPVGVYAQNNQFPLAEVRVLLYGDGDVTAVDLNGVYGVIGADVYCDMPLTGTNADSGIASIGEHKRWQPVDGEFEFSVKANKAIPSNAPVLVCFRWKLDKGDPRRFYNSGPTRILDRQPQSIKIAATVLPIPDQPSWWQTETKEKTIEPRVSAHAIPFIGLVPFADARILIVDSDGAPVVDVLTKVGITNLYFATVMTLAIVIFAFYILSRVCKKRLEPVPNCGALLCTITMRRGYASLSQFQIILWTFVVIISAI